MRKFFDILFKSQSLIYKYVLYLASVFCIVFFFPKGGQFKYEFQKGKPWQYENLYAPFDFSIRKTQNEIEKEKSEINATQLSYYRYDAQVVKKAYTDFDAKFIETFPSQEYDENQLKTLYTAGKEILNEVYAYGILPDGVQRDQKEIIYLVRKNEADRVAFEKLFDLPAYWTVDEVIDNITEEADFRLEAQNTARARVGPFPLLTRDSDHTSFTPVCNARRTWWVMCPRCTCRWCTTRC